jgi:hypothetical protein
MAGYGHFERHGSLFSRAGVGSKTKTGYFQAESAFQVWTAFLGLPGVLRGGSGLVSLGFGMDSVRIT